VSESTPRMRFTYPNFRKSPWYDDFETFMGEVDASVYTTREDRNIVLAEGGTVAWDSASGILSWSTILYLNASITGFLWRVAAGSATLEEGELLYATLVRNPSTNTTVVVSVASQVPSTDGGVMLCYRLNDRIYWRDGKVIENGYSGALFTTSTGTATTPTLAAVLAAGNGSGGTDIELASSKVVGAFGQDALLEGGDGSAVAPAGDGRVKGGDNSGAADGGDVRLTPGSGTPDGRVKLEGDSDLDGVLRFTEKSLPTTTATEAAVFVSDGSGSETQGELYFRKNADGVVVPLTLRSIDPRALFALNESVDGVTSTKALGGVPFDATGLSGSTVKFRAVLNCTVGTITGRARLYNVTDSEFVTTADVNTTNTTPTIREATVTVGSGAGELKESEKVYQVRITNTGTLTGEVVYLGSAFLIVE